MLYSLENDWTLWIGIRRELIEIVKAYNEITCATLHKIRLKKVNDDHYICRADKKDGGVISGGGGGEQATDEAGPSRTTRENYVMITYVPSVDRGWPL